MEQILIGSRAIKHYYPDFPREPNDTDYAMKVKIQSEVRGIELLYNPILFKYTKDKVLPPNLMTTLKASHLFWEFRWDKHMFDLQFLLRKGHSVDLSLMRELFKFFEQELPKVRRSNLNSTKDDFFTNSVNEDTDEHDQYHEILKEEPAYKKILKSEVEVCELKFNSLSLSEKMDVATEEAIVMAVERYYKRTEPFVMFYREQLKNNIIKHYPDFIAKFTMENFIELTSQEHLNKYKYNKLLNHVRTRKD